MQRIILPVSAAPPQARAPDIGVKSGADGPGGLFGILLSAQVANGGTSKGIGKKAEEGLNPMAALLLSALMQGSIFNQGNTVSEAKSEGSPHAAVDAVDLGGVAPAQSWALPASWDAALGRLMEADPRLSGELNRMLALAETGGTQGSAQEKLAALMRRASQGETAMDEEAARALNEIRRLFAELLGRDAAGAETTRSGSAQQPAAQRIEADALRAPAEVGIAPPAVEGGNPRLEAGPEAAPQQAAANIAQSARGAADKAAAENAGEALAGKQETPPAGNSKPAPEREAVEFAYAPKPAQGYEAAAVERGARAESPVIISAQRAFDDIVDRIAMMKAAARSEMEISLKPEFLGKVVIRLTMDEGGLVAKIAAANPQVQDAFLGQASALQASLESQGLRDVRVVVTSSTVPDASLQQQAERRGQEEPRERGRRMVSLDAAQPGVEAGIASAYEWYWRSGTIDYLA